MKYFKFNVIRDEQIDFTPTKSNITDTGYDCRAYLPTQNEVVIKPISEEFVNNNTSIFLRPFNHVKIPLGFSIDILQETISFIDFTKIIKISQFHEQWGIGIDFKIAFNMRMRSGLAFNNGLQCHFGTIDTLYNNQLYVMAYNTSNVPIVVKHGDRICQLCVEFVPILDNEVNYVDTIEELNGGKRGSFGSTGLK